ncbi:MAG: antitoxin [Trueperaceae bacterium]
MLPLGIPNGNAVTKFTVSIPSELARLLESYQKSHDLGSRSAVIAKGLEQLREAELAAAYRTHATEWQEEPDKDFWDKAP